MNTGQVESRLSAYQLGVLRAVGRVGLLLWWDDGVELRLAVGGTELPRPRRDSVKRLIRAGLLAREDERLSQFQREAGVKAYAVTEEGKRELGGAEGERRRDGEREREGNRSNRSDRAYRSDEMTGRGSRRSTAPGVPRGSPKRRPTAPRPMAPGQI